MIIPTLLFIFLGWRVYLHAVSHGKNGMRWALFTVAVAVVIQVAVMLIFWGIGGLIDGRYGTTTVDDYSMISAVVGLILSLIAVLIISNRISEGGEPTAK